MKHAIIALLVFASCYPAYCKAVLPNPPDNGMVLQQKADVRVWGLGRNDGLLTGYAFTHRIKGSVYGTDGLPLRHFVGMTGHCLLPPINNHYILMNI